MNYREKNSHIMTKIFGFISLIMTAGIFCGFAMFATAGRFESFKANKILLNIDSMTKEAYKESQQLDKINTAVAKMDIEEDCSIVKSSGAWYMVCNVYDMTGGDKNEQEIVLKNFAKYKKQEGIISPSSLAIKDEDFDPSKCIAVFLRFSSAKQDKSSNNPEGNFVKNLEQNSKILHEPLI